MDELLDVYEDNNYGQWGDSRLGYYFWDKGLKDFFFINLGVYHDFLLFDQYF